MSVIRKDIDGFPGYQVGSDGSVWTCRKPGRYPALTGNWRQLAPRKSGTQKTYRFVQLCRGAGTKPTPAYIHHLVLKAFIGPCPEGMEAIHKNDIQWDNRLENLEWGTHKRNCELRRTNGKDVRRKLTDADVVWIRTNPEQLTPKQMTKRLGITKHTISDIIRKKTWKHVS